MLVLLLLHGPKTRKQRALRTESIVGRLPEGLVGACPTTLDMSDRCSVAKGGTSEILLAQPCSFAVGCELLAQHPAQLSYGFVLR